MFNSVQPPEHVPDTAALNWLLASSTLIVALHAQHLPSWLCLIAACLIAWRYLSANHAWYLPGRWVRIVIAIALCVVVLKHFGTLLGRGPGIALVTALMTLKLLELRRLRDFTFVIFLLYFLCLAAFLYSQSFWVAGYAVAIALITTISLIRITQPLAMPTRYVWSLSLGLLLKAVPLMLVMYFLFPRIQGTLWGLPVDAYSGMTGLTDTVTPGAINQLLGSDEIAFRVKFDGEPPANRDLYWRALVLADTDGVTWTRSSNSHLIIDSLDYQPIGDSVSYAITLEPHDQPWLIALDLPASVPVDARAKRGFVLVRRRAVRERIRYQLHSYPNYDTGELAMAERREALSLPETLSPRVKTLVTTWQSQYGEPGSIVAAALNHFNQQEFLYTLTPPLLGDDPVDEFLFDTRKGYCEHFASAFVTLMRAAGIPSRMVIGYQGGELNTLADYMIVRQSDAHAWAEVWIAGRGWVRVDPTGAVAPERIELGVEAILRLVARGSSIGRLTPDAILGAIRPGWTEHYWRGLLHGWDAMNNVWNRWVLDYGPDSQRQLLQRLGFDTPSWTQMAATLAAAVALVFLLLTALILRNQRPDPALAWYQRFCRKLTRVGLHRAEYEGPIDFAARASRALPSLATEVRAITDLYVAIRYADRSGIAAQAELKRRVQQLRVSHAMVTTSSA
ncbi:MAG: DUF3488 and transglutaminase-like domain-containing protein [Gammaproteobacteria bacterium]|nr:DUF3488 and transglutaminase-like domain-containing protein [Gammaproteobacteria bacterium]